MPNHRASNSSKDKAEAGNDGEWLNKVSAPYEAAPLYATQRVEMGGGVSPQKLVRDSRLARTNNQCKALPKRLVRMGL